MIPDELKDWDEIIKNGNGNEDNRAQSQLRAAKKLVIAITNLQNHIFSLQKVLGKRMDDSIEITKENNKVSTKLYKIYIWLTFIIAFSAIASLAISIISLIISLRK